MQIARLHGRLKFSANTALIGGIILPAMETIRRRHELLDASKILNWADDYLIGVFLIFAALKTRINPRRGKNFLSGAWGFAAGMGFGSFTWQLQRLGEPDPSQLHPGIVVAVKGSMLVLSIICLLFTMPREHAELS